MRNQLQGRLPLNGRFGPILLKNAAVAERARSAWSKLPTQAEATAMMGREEGAQAPLFYSFNLDAHIPSTICSEAPIISLSRAVPSCRNHDCVHLNHGTSASSAGCRASGIRDGPAKVAGP